MRASGLILAGSLALAACGGEKTVYSDTDGNEVKVTRDDDGDASEIKIESSDGSAVININGANGDARLPLGLKAYPGARMVSTMVGNSDGKDGGMYVMESDADRDTVIEWYRKAAVANGFKIESEITTQDLKSIAGTKDGGSFSLQVTPAESGSSITLIAGEN